MAHTPHYLTSAALLCVTLLCGLMLLKHMMLQMYKNIVWQGCTINLSLVLYIRASSLGLNV